MTKQTVIYLAIGLAIGVLFGQTLKEQLVKLFKGA